MSSEWPGTAFDYGVVTATVELVGDFVDGDLDVRAARARLDDIPDWARSWSTTVVMIAVTLAGAAAPLIYGGDWRSSIIGAVTYPVLMLLVQFLGKIGWPEFFTQVVSGLLASATAAVARLIDPRIDPTSMVIAVIIIMMAGMTSTGAVRDAITGYHLSGLGRIFVGVVNTVGLVVGVRLGASFFSSVGIDLPVDNQVSLATLPLWVMLLASAFVAVGTGIVLQSPLRILWVTAIVSILVYGSFAMVSTGSGPDAGARALAAMVAGAGAVVGSRLSKAPASAVSLCSVLVLLPGTLLYQAVWGTSVNQGGAWTYLASALIAALALAAGAMTGEYLASTVWGALRLAGHRLFTPSSGQREAGSVLSGRRGTTTGGFEDSGDSLQD